MIKFFAVTVRVFHPFASLSSYFRSTVYIERTLFPSSLSPRARDFLPSAKRFLAAAASIRTERSSLFVLFFFGEGENARDRLLFPVAMKRDTERTLYRVRLGQQIVQVLSIFKKNPSPGENISGARPRG